MARNVTGTGQVGQDAKREVRKAAASPWTERLARLGYFVRGFVYAIPGLLALQLALGMGGGVTTPTGAIMYIGRQPGGNILLIIVAIGLVGYSIWGLIRAVFDPFRHGNDPEGLMKRFGYIVSAFGYGTLLIATLQYIAGRAVSSNNPQDWTAKLLTQPWGRFAVAIIGIGWLAGGLWQIYTGWKADFKDQFKWREMNREEKVWSVRVGRLGLAARGVVFALIGLFLVQAAYFANASAAKGLDGALLALVQKPYGQVLLAIVAIGLIAFGIYSMLLARWARIQVR